MASKSINAREFSAWISTPSIASWRNVHIRPPLQGEMLGILADYGPIGNIVNRSIDETIVFLSRWPWPPPSSQRGGI